MSKISNYYENHYKHVNTNFNLNKYTKQIKLELKDFLKNTSLRVLEVGSGCGYLLKVLENEGFHNLTGIEIDSYQCSESKKLLTISEIYNIGIIDYLQKIENDTNKYDIIIMYDLIEHIPKDEVLELLKQLYKNMNTEASLIIKTPNMDSPLFGVMMRYIDFTHELGLSEISMKMILRESGFSNIFCTGVPVCIKSPLSYIPIILKSIFEFFLKSLFFIYIGKRAYKLIFTPNFITIARK